MSRVIPLESPYGNAAVVKHDSVVFGIGVAVPYKRPKLNLDGTTEMVEDTKVILMPAREMPRSRSRYIPHQGRRECARRIA